MEALKHTPINEAQVHRNGLQQLAEIARFHSNFRRNLEQSTQDANTISLAESFFHDFHKKSLDDFLYRIGFLSLDEVDKPTTPNTADERVGTALFMPFIKRVDDIMDSPTYPRFSSTEAFKSHLLDQPVTFGEPPITLSVTELKNLVMRHFNPEKQQVLEDYINRAADSQFRHSHLGEPGTYGYDDVFRYKIETTVEWFVAARRLLNIPPDPGFPMFSAQLIDDAVDMSSDARNHHVNMWIGTARDTGELDILLSDTNNQEATGKLAKVKRLYEERQVRHRMPRTYEFYMEQINKEVSQKRSRAAKMTVVAFSKLI